MNTKRRDDILDKARQIFAEKGYDGTTVEAIAQELGCTKQALYYYFHSKDDILVSLIEESLDRSLERMIAIEASGAGPDQRLRALIAYYFEDYLGGGGFFKLYHQVESYLARLLAEGKGSALQEKMATMNGLIMRLVQAGIDSGHFLPLDQRFLGGMILSMLTGVLFHLDHPSLRGIDPGLLTRQATDIIMRGISHEH